MPDIATIVMMLIAGSGLLLVLRIILKIFAIFAMIRLYAKYALIIGALGTGGAGLLMASGSPDSWARQTIAIIAK